MNYSLIIDTVFVIIIVVLMMLCAKRGLFKSISGIAGTVVGFIGARAFGPPASKIISDLTRPIFSRAFHTEKVQAAFANAAQRAADGIDSIKESLLSSGLSQKSADLISGVFENMGSSLSEFAALQAEGTLGEALAHRAAELLAPVLAFILLFILIKLLVVLLCRILSANIPVVREVNRLGGALLGIISGLLIVILICWGAVLFAPQENVGFFSLQTVENSLLGGYITDIFW